MTSHVTLHNIRHSVHIKFLHRTQRLGRNGLEPTASRISKIYVSVGVTMASMNILRHKFKLKIFGKPPVLRCGRNVGLSCHTERSHSCAIFPGVMLLLFVLSYKH